MEYLIIAALVASLLTGVMYLDARVSSYRRTKGYFIKLFIASFVVTASVNYMVSKGNALKERFRAMPPVGIDPGRPNF